MRFRIAVGVLFVAVVATVSLFFSDASPLTGQGGFPIGNCNNDGVCDAIEGHYTCSTDCPTPPCGDGYCDNRESLEGEYACPKDCVKQPETVWGPSCGNGRLDIGLVTGEECDDRNRTPGDGCSPACLFECGDGVRDDDPTDGYVEACDSKEQGCTEKCTWAVQLGGVMPVEPLKPVCKPLDPEFNDAEADRVNVVFAGVGVDGTGALLEALQVSADQLFEREPFKSQSEKVQFWYHPDIVPLTNTTDDWEKTCMEGCESDAQCPELTNVNRSLICARECRSHAFFGGDAHVSYPDIMSSWRFIGGSVFVHEFGHQFGLLADEYIEANVGAWPKKPNCAPDTATARRWWGSQVNDGASTGYQVDYFGGCSYEAKNVRPTERSVMFHGFGDFGPVSEPWIATILQVYSGFSPNGRNERDVEEPPTTEMAWEVVFEKQVDGSYGIVSEKPVEVPFGVKPTMESGMEATVLIGDRSYTQTFATEDVGIGEHFREDGSVDHGDTTRIPRTRVTVQIGLGETTAADLQNVRPITMIAPCNDNDAASDNDCAPPMYRGASLVPPVQTPSSRSSSSVRPTSSSVLPVSSSSSRPTSSSPRSSSVQTVVLSASSKSSSRVSSVPASSVRSSVLSVPPRPSSVPSPRSSVTPASSSRMSLALDVSSVSSSVPPMPSSSSSVRPALPVAADVVYAPAAPHAPVGNTGPASAALMAAGAAAGIGWVRKKRR